MLILTWNIRWGLGVDGRVDLERIASDARRLADADILCFQEVSDRFSELKGNDDANQFAHLAALFPQHEAIDGVVLDVRAPDGGRKRFGNMILSRYPVEQVLRHTLPWTTEPDAECMPRGLIEVVVRAPLGPLRLMTTHLEWSSPVLRARQVEAIRQVHERSCRRVALPAKAGKDTYAPQLGTRSAILTGDFNMTPDEQTMRVLTQAHSTDVPHFVYAWESLNPEGPHPASMSLHDTSDGPPRCLDYVLLTSDLKPRLRSIVYDQTSRASDHQPVIVELD